LGTIDPPTAFRALTGRRRKIFFTVVVPASRWSDR